jgi:hypothetical protein
LDRVEVTALLSMMMHWTLFLSSALFLQAVQADIHLMLLEESQQLIAVPSNGVNCDAILAPLPPTCSGRASTTAVFNCAVGNLCNGPFHQLDFIPFQNPTSGSFFDVYANTAAGDGPLLGSCYQGGMNVVTCTQDDDTEVHAQDWAFCTFFTKDIMCPSG